MSKKNRETGLRVDPWKYPHWIDENIQGTNSEKVTSEMGGEAKKCPEAKQGNCEKETQVSRCFHWLQPAHMWEGLRENLAKPGVMTHACNPSYVGNHSLRLAPLKDVRPYLKKKRRGVKDVAHGLELLPSKPKALSSSLSTSQNRESPVTQKFQFWNLVL
jgi:hypothetical protein